MRGMGSMIHYLGGGSKQTPEKYIGKVIKDIHFDSNIFTIKFADDVEIDITDEGQSCCESRYMTCDDDVKTLVGQTLKHIIVKDSEDKSDKEGYGVHEVCFLEVQGDKSSVTFATHNEHNGYYGGFGLNISERGK